MNRKQYPPSQGSIVPAVHYSELNFSHIFKIDNVVFPFCSLVSLESIFLSICINNKTCNRLKHFDEIVCASIAASELLSWSSAKEWSCYEMHRRRCKAFHSISWGMLETIKIRMLHLSLYFQSRTIFYLLDNAFASTLSTEMMHHIIFFCFNCWKKFTPKVFYRILW